MPRKGPDWLQIDPLIDKLKADGRNDSQIAKELGIARQTLVDHLRSREPAHQENTMTDEPVDVLPGQMRFDTTDTTPPPAGGDAVSAVADIVPVAIDVLDRLSPDEVRTLEHYEEIIAQGIQTFVQVGQALLAIRDRKLYRADYPTFEEYCRQRWDLSRPYAYQLMEASLVVEHVSAVADILPANEAQARPLTRLEPAQQQEVWREAVETAPPSGITAKHVQATVKRVSGQKGSTFTGKSQAEETRERMGERGQPNHSWINVLSHAHRLCSSLRRQSDLHAILESWGVEGRQKAVSYLKPLYEDTQQLLWSLKAIDAQPYREQAPDTSQTTEALDSPGEA